MRQMYEHPPPRNSRCRMAARICATTKAPTVERRWTPSSFGSVIWGRFRDIAEVSFNAQEVALPRGQQHVHIEKRALPLCSSPKAVLLMMIES